MRSILRLCLFALAICGLAASEIDGKWEFVMQTDGGERRVTPELKADGEKVSGKWDRADVAGTFKDNELLLSFPLTSTEGQMTAKLNIKAKLSAGQLTGNWEFGGYSGSFTGKKSQ
jgi:hypothetical protein